MCGIFAFLNFGDAKVTRADVIRKLLQGLRRLEYRGYDSAGFCVEGPAGPMVQRVVGGVDNLEKSIDFGAVSGHELLGNHIAIAHTRWATHGEPAVRNTHPLVSDAKCEFAVVHNGIITNYRSLRATLQKHGHVFTSDTDTEVVAALLKFVFDNTPRGQFTFCDLVAHVVARLEGAYALLIRSTHYPGELVATKKGSPLVIGMVKSSSSTSSAAGELPRPDRASGRGLATSPVPASVPVDYVTLEEATVRDADEGPEATGRSEFLSIRKLSTNRGNPVGSISDSEAEADDERSGHHGGPSSAAVSVARPRAAGTTSGSDDPEQVDIVGRSPSSKGVSGRRPPQSASYAISSDPAALLDHTKRVVYLKDGDVAHLTPSGLLRLYRGQALAATDDAAERVIETLTMEVDQISRGGYAHFMLKEIFEQPESLANTMRGRVQFDKGQVHLGGLAPHIKSIRRSQRIMMVACGTSYNSCVATRELFERMSELPVDVLLASELLDRETPVFRGDTCIFVSQSGETADTLRALEHCRSHGAFTVGVVNIVGSAIARLTHCGAYLNAGPEIGVASTKAYTSQVVVLSLIAIFIGQDRVSQTKHCMALCQALKRVPEQVGQVLANTDPVREMARRLKTTHNLLMVGRGYQFATCREAALKIKEIAYIHTEAISGGELKHGPLALITEETALTMVLTRDHLYDRSLNALHQVTARKGRPVVMITEGDPLGTALRESGLHVIEVPETHAALQTILNVIPFQLVSYYVALEKGYNVDRPRNLAKSVTVE